MILKRRLQDGDSDDRGALDGCLVPVILGGISQKKEVDRKIEDVDDGKVDEGGARVVAPLQFEVGELELDLLDLFV